MPVPTLITDLSTVANSNSPPGTESAKGNIDNYLRAHASFIKQAYNAAQDNSLTWAGTAGGTANALTLTLSPAITAIAAGQRFAFKSGASPNSAATTVAISGLTAIAAQVNGAACVGGEILANSWYEILANTTTTCQLSKIGRATLAELGAAASGDIKTAPNFANSSTMVAQRTTAPALSTTRQIGLCDNIGVWASGGAVSAGTISQITTAISGTTGYAARAAGVTLTGSGQISHSAFMEAKDAIKYKNKTASFSVKVDHDVGSNVNYTLAVKKPTVADTFSATTVIATGAATAVVTATGTTLTFNGVAMGDCSNGIELEVQAACGAVTTKNFNCTEFSIAVAAIAPAYVAPDHADEQRRCQRYLPAFNGVTATDDVGWGGNNSTSAGFISYQYLVEPRVPPTGITTSAVGGFTFATMTVASAVTVLTFSRSGKRMCLVQVTGTGTPYTVGQAVVLAGGIGSQILFTGCELL